MPVPYQESNSLPCIHPTSLTLVSDSQVQLEDNLRGSQGGKEQGLKIVFSSMVEKKKRCQIISSGS